MNTRSDFPQLNKVLNETFANAKTALLNDDRKTLAIEVIKFFPEYVITESSDTRIVLKNGYVEIDLAGQTRKEVLLKLFAWLVSEYSRQLIESLPYEDSDIKTMSNIIESFLGLEVFLSDSNWTCVMLRSSGSNENFILYALPGQSRTARLAEFFTYAFCGQLNQFHLITLSTTLRTS